MESNDDPFERIAGLQRQLERRDQEMSRLREENARLIGKAAHDLRHPVSALLTYSELLLESEETALSDDNRALVIEMRRCGELMRKMLDDVFEIARLDSIRFDWEPAAVEELVTQSVDALTSMAVRKKIQIQVAAEIGIPIVRKYSGVARRTDTFRCSANTSAGRPSIAIGCSEPPCIGRLSMAATERTPGSAATRGRNSS